MALYRLEMQNVSRSNGVSSVAKAAYRHRCEMIDERTGEVHGKKSANRGDLIYAEILRPEDVPECLHIPSAELWNLVEKTEKRKDARTAKEFKITLPCELSNDQNIKLLKDYLLKNFVEKGIICDFVIHNDKENKNPHAHVMITTREIKPDGFGKKVREWDTEESLNNWRKEWAIEQNKHLKKLGFKSRVSHKSLQEQKENALVQAKKSEEMKDHDKAILWLAKAVELDRPPMKNLPRKIWNTEAGQKQRQEDQRARQRAKGEAAAIKALRGFAVVDVSSFVVHPLEKKEHSKNIDFGFIKSWWKQINNLVDKVKVKFSAKTDMKPVQKKEPELEYMVDPVTGLTITKQKWKEMAERANVKTPEATISYKGKQSDSLTQKTAQKAIQSDLDVSESKTIRSRTAPAPGRRRRRNTEEDTKSS
ncbi:hypothetical protein D9555_21010 [Shigella sonnei]|nr:hypothetical protein [Shigella sonnei]